MRRIAFALLALAIAAPSYAQDWERVFDTIADPGGGYKVLLLDPSQPRTSTDRYKLVSLADLLSGVVDFRCRYVAAKGLEGAFTAAEFIAGNSGCDKRVGVRVPDPGVGAVWGYVAVAVPAGGPAPDYLGYATATSNPGIDQSDLFIEQADGVTIDGVALDVWVIRVSTLQHRGQAVYFSQDARAPGR